MPVIPPGHEVDGGTNPNSADTDDARFYLIQDLLGSGTLARFGYTKGVGYASREAPRRNFTGDPYFTDGLRAVFFLGRNHVEYDEIRHNLSGPEFEALFAVPDAVQALLVGKAW